MNKRIRDKFCKALESKKYKQGYGKLHGGDGSYCVLGVLTDLYIKEHTDARWSPPTQAYNYYALWGNGHILDRHVSKWAGLENGTWFDATKLSPGLKAYLTKKGNLRTRLSLMYLNDGAHVKFPTLAKIIKQVF